MAVNAAEIVDIANYIQQVKKLVATTTKTTTNQELQRRVAAKVGDSSMTALHELMEQHNQQLQNLRAAVATAESFTRDIDKVDEVMIQPISRTLSKLESKIILYLFEALEKKCIPMINSIPEKKKRKELFGILNEAMRNRQIYLESHLHLLADDAAEVVDAFNKMKIEAEVVELFSRL